MHASHIKYVQIKDWAPLNNNDEAPIDSLHYLVEIRK